MSQFHTPVLLSEAIDALAVRPNGKYIDGTIGGGGHTYAILARGGHVLGLDVDVRALDECTQRFGLKKVVDSAADPFSMLYARGKQLTLVKTNFRLLFATADKYGFLNADGVLLDLGVSSFQLDTPGYGLSFRLDEPLDMRLDSSLAVTADTIVNHFPEKELAMVFREYGEELHANRIAHEIITAREKKPIASTAQLAALVEKVIPRRGKIHPATRIFQALRIVVNSELGALEEGLNNATTVLKKEGRLVVISFHSLEDRIVKKYMQNSHKLQMITETPIGPTANEITDNPRARSAKMRIAIKI